MNADPEPGTIRRRVVYHGRVQGVCFRAVSSQLAQDYQVAGYVRNLPDGTVELEAEGPSGEVERFLGSVGAEFKHHITRASVTDVSPQGAGGAFRIRY